MILNFHDRLDRVLNVTKSRQDNDVIDNIGLVYFKTETKLSGPIWLGAVCKENQTRQRHDIGLVDAEIEFELSGPIWLGAIYDEN